jgi:hypothetical protein
MGVEKITAGFPVKRDIQASRVISVAPTAFLNQ